MYGPQRFHGSKAADPVGHPQVGGLFNKLKKKHNPIHGNGINIWN